MAYETEALPGIPNNAMPAASPIEMREERTIEPYRKTTTKLASVNNEAPKTGQPNIGKESVAAETSPKPEETVTLSPQMAALARKEQKFRRDQQALKVEREAIEREKAEIAEFKAMKEKLAQKDYSGVEPLIDYNDYTRYQIEKAGSQDPVQEKFKNLEAKVDSVEKAHQEDISKRFEAAVNERRSQATQLVESNPDFAIIKRAGATEGIVQYILDVWEEKGVEPTIEEAAKEVKELLLERAQKTAELLKSTESNEAPSDGKKELPPLKPGIKTLTNTMAPTGEITRPKKPYSGMSDSERWKEARRRVEERMKQGK